MAFTTNRSNMFYGTTTDIDSYIGRQGELSLDIQNNQLRVLDGTTPGGTPLALGNWDLDVTIGGASPITVTSDMVLVAVTLQSSNASTLVASRKIANLPSSPVDGEQHYVTCTVVTQETAADAYGGFVTVTPTGGKKIAGRGTAGYSSVRLTGDTGSGSFLINGAIHLVWSSSLDLWLVLGVTYQNVSFNA